jgi:hypothetical protein
VTELPGTPLYNVIHGTNRYALFWLGMLQLPPDVVGRFRDCYLQRGHAGAIEICIYTRNGGSFRERTALATMLLRTHPLYLRDYDADHDSTYAAYIFRPTELMRPTIDLIVSRDSERAIPGSHRERSEAFLLKMQRDPHNSDVRRAKAAVSSLGVELSDDLRGWV